MDESAPIIKYIHTILRSELEKTNRKFNEDLVPIVKKINDLKYSKFRQCIMKDEKFNNCLKSVEKYSFEIDFSTPNKNVVECADEILERRQKSENVDVQNEIVKCVQKY